VVRAEIDDIGRELEIDGIERLTPAAALAEIRDQIGRIKNPSSDTSDDSANPQLSKGDSLAASIQHNAAMRQELDEKLTQAREIIAKIAAAMQISKWDADGTEILEKIQRWESFKHVLARRIQYLSGPSGNGVPETHKFCADELRSHLARLMAPREFAKWLENRPKGTVTAQVAEIANLPVPTFDPFTPAHLLDLVDRLRQAPEGRSSGYLGRAIQDIAHSATAAGEFVRLLNLIVLPLVARQRAASGSDSGHLAAP
jgi:hypothetical protein